VPPLLGLEGVVGCVGTTVLELVLDDVVGLGLGLCFGGGGDLRSGIAAFALTAVTPTVCAPWTLVLGASWGAAG
jgi:hypothetical protein